MSQSYIQPYLFFGGRCEEAIEFYKAAIGAEVQMLMRYSDSPDPMPPDTLPEGYESKVMHASFKVGSSVILASDGCGGEESKGFLGFSLSLALPTEAETERAFNALAEGGAVNMPLGKTFWSSRFGMLQDKFGMGWMVTVAPDTDAKPA
ncbi:MAG: VOC family protein [Prosthecobacter sp.]|uniref:VOC family protein n=1 Tax=Prosthecobacter sp. TaxID=1965333 RepID=UPI0025DA46B4|nr:VOC family protein [Prosthecobacter sp.]MCF7786560.1 VOC family protein [Prosthecobacter sp.]